ncbi:hypothetical protein [Neobacillus sp. PS2-9]|uniref:hypothetical protein n=1 Tax=Neobacillus sp. PS2-9 TaxID=3070676 RepID=UPI0027E1B459|nr:hypothetical protein [Neobacillus sp. PS2-9]WML58602.1 hypothetical protein RCG25_02070 [Neobacillus sp. PS2-9]
MIAQNLLTALSKSEEDFFNYIDQLSGRHFIFYGDSENATILSDATGMRTIFYSTTQNIIGSHCELVQEYINSPHSTTVNKEWLKEYTSASLPGHYTPYEDIYFLIPNTLLTLPSKQVKRFFPREELTIAPIEDIVASISESVKNQLQLLSKKHDLLFSLTAGLDSRTSLALLKDYKDQFQYFTYSKTSEVKSLEIDKHVVKELSYNLGLNHRFLTIDTPSTDDIDSKNIREVLRKNTFSSHSFHLAKIYLDTFSQNSLHIRSNLYEIGRMYYKLNYKNLPKVFGSDSMALLYSKKAVNDPKVKQAFDHYYKHVEMDKIYNYDPYDLLYWEFRMGAWHALLLLESDIAFDSFILFNSRKILKLLLSVSAEDKKEHTVFKKIIDTNWPVLNYWKINSTENLSDFYDEKFDEFGLHLDNFQFSSGSQTNLERTVPMKIISQPRRAKFHIDLSAPLEGDFIEARLPVVTKFEKGQYCSIQLRSPYQNPSNAGRLKYQILLDEKVLMEEDISLWKESNQILIKWIPENAMSHISIRTIAIKNCESWNWGKASTLLIERISVGKLDTTNKVEVTASSPFSIIK